MLISDLSPLSEHFKIRMLLQPFALPARSDKDSTLDGFCYLFLRYEYLL